MSSSVNTSTLIGIFKQNGKKTHRGCNDAYKISRLKQPQNVFTYTVKLFFFGVNSCIWINFFLVTEH